MEKLILQQDRRHGRLSEFIKSSDETMTLGRGLSNDVIIADHFIAAEQLRFDYEQGLWKLNLLDETNPVLLNNKPIGKDGVVVKSNDQLIVGRTHLILLLSNHPVERTRKLMLSNWMYHKVLHFALPIAMLLVSALLAVFTEYQEISGKIRWGQMVASGLGYALFVSFWAGCWALVGRLLRHKPNFFAQLFYTSLTMAGINFGALFYGYTEYTTTSNVLGYIIEWGFLLLMLGILLKYNLTYATELKRRNLIAFSVIGISMLLSISMTYLGQRDFSSQPDYSATVKPPLAKWSSDNTVNDYMQNLSLQLEKLEKELVEIDTVDSMKEKN